jgi:alkylation response protein AidB-like acyl-CoA dehydrogenase
MEMDLPEFALFMEELAVVDGSFAWSVNLGAGANMFAGYLDKEVASIIFSDPKTCIAGSGAVSGIAEERGDQYYITGSWKYASGSSHANFFSLNARLINNKENDDFSSFIIPSKEVEVLDTWKTTGLRATASHDFRVDGCSVPKGYSFNLLQPSPNCTGILYHFPFQLLAEINMLVMTSGLAKRFLELVKQISLSKLIKVEGPALSELSEFRRLIEAREKEFFAAREAVFASLSFLWNELSADNKVSLRDQQTFTKQVLQAAESSRSLVDSLYPFMGMHTVFESSEVNRVWRDFKTASQHALISPVRFID